MIPNQSPDHASMMDLQGGKIMRKILILILALIMALSVVSCGRDDKTENEVKEINTSDKTDNEGVEDVTKEEPTQIVTEISPEVVLNDQKSDETAVTDGSAESEEGAEDNGETVQEESTAMILYKSFMDGGVAKAKYLGNADRTSYLNTRSVLEAGKFYSWEDISKALENSDEFVTYVQSGDVEYSFIDCGNDGVQELYAQALFNDEFSLHMIIKEFDRELRIIFTQDGWSRSYVTIEPDGKITTEGSGGANVHIIDHSYIDADGNYTYYYGMSETIGLFGNIYAYRRDNDYVTISTDDLDTDHIGIREYYVENENATRSYYYEYFIMDDEYNDITTDADYDDSNELKKRFKEAGIKTYTHAEMEKFLSELADNIGYDK